MYIWIYSKELKFIVFLSYLIRSYQLVCYGEASPAWSSDRICLIYGVIKDCVADEIIMLNDIHKDMNIDYGA